MWILCYVAILLYGTRTEAATDEPNYKSNTRCWMKDEELAQLDSLLHCERIAGTLHIGKFTRLGTSLTGWRGNIEACLKIHDTDLEHLDFLFFTTHNRCGRGGSVIANNSQLCLGPALRTELERMYHNLNITQIDGDVCEQPFSVDKSNKMNILTERPSSLIGTPGSLVTFNTTWHAGFGDWDDTRVTYTNVSLNINLDPKSKDSIAQFISFRHLRMIYVNKSGPVLTIRGTEETPVYLPELKRIRNDGKGPSVRVIQSGSFSLDKDTMKILRDASRNKVQVVKEKKKKLPKPEIQFRGYEEPLSRRGNVTERTDYFDKVELYLHMALAFLVGITIILACVILFNKDRSLIVPFP